MNLDNTAVQMRKGILEFCVLHVISRGEIYTSDLIAELQRARMVVVEGTLYPLLTRLKNAGLLQYNWRESPSGPPRKYYALTEAGAHMLAQLAETWQEMVASVVTILEPRPGNAISDLPTIETAEALSQEPPGPEAPPAYLNVDPDRHPDQAII